MKVERDVEEKVIRFAVRRLVVRSMRLDFSRSINMSL